MLVPALQSAITDQFDAYIFWVFTNLFEILSLFLMNQKLPYCIRVFQLLDLIIMELKSHLTLLKIQGLSLVEILFVKKDPLQDLLSSLNAVISTNERH
jgi:hypothetical protein